ncbi:hypothetical protein Tco_1565647, partial [Tanacetum coccineum]
MEESSGSKTTLSTPVKFTCGKGAMLDSTLPKRDIAIEFSYLCYAYHEAYDNAFNVQIVDRLHWYVQDGDTIVDFCCGSNDFSVFMKEKLDITGKKCLFRNYDLITPK